MVNTFVMKILNQTTKDATYPFPTTSLYELPLTVEMIPESYIHIVQQEDGGYSSKKMSIQTFNNKVYQSVNNTFKVDYWREHNHYRPNPETGRYDDGNSVKEEDGEEYSFIRMIEHLGSEAPERIGFTETNFVKHLNYDFSVLRRYVVKRNLELQDEIDNAMYNVSELDCMFQGRMAITTTNKDNETTHDSVNHKKSENDRTCQLQIKEGNKISTNNWTVPETGNLVMYGWLDSSSALNNKAIPSSYCVVEASINGVWEIIGVQPVIPEKTLTYVGFTLPVRKGLVIRVRTGFNVGAKSGQYSNEQDGYDTLSNSTPNGFKCQVFSNPNGSLESSDREIV